MFFIFEQLDTLVEAGANAIGQPFDQLKVVFCLILQVVLGITMNIFVASPGLPRYLFNTICGVVLQIYMYRSDVIHVYILAFGTYFLMNMASRQQQHKYVMAFLTLYLSGQHIHRMMNEQGYRLDITT